jgi:hypothetical protein
MAISYKDFTDGKTPLPVEAIHDKHWWTLKGEEAAQAITAVLHVLTNNQKGREYRYLRNARLYGNLPLLAGISGLAVSRLAAANNSNAITTDDRLKYNVCQSAVDTVTAKMAKNKPKPLFLTQGGDSKKQRRAKKLNKFVEGIFYENQVYDVDHGNPMVFRTGAVLGTGAVHVFSHHGRVCFERVLPNELKVDEIEAFYGKPRQLHREKPVDRMVVLEMFPDSKEQIMRAKRADKEQTGFFPTVSDQIMVRESWHLPSGPKAKDGMRFMSLENGTLGGKPWKRDHFPFAFFHWNKPLFGFWGESAIDQIIGLQLEINKLLWVAQRSFHMAGTFKVFLPVATKLVKEFLSNDVGLVIPYVGEQPPQYVVPQILPPEFLNHLWNLKNAAFEQLGVSLLSAASKKPDGLNSGRALREFNDIESDRFQIVGQAYEQLAVDESKLAVYEAKDLYGEEGSYKVKVPGKRFIQEIDWKDIDLDEEDYVTQIYPVSSLPNEPAGRFQTVQEYVQAGWYTPREGKRLMDFPDTGAADELGDAQEDYLHMCFEKMIEDGEYTPPESYDDLHLAKQLALEYYAQGKNQNLEEEKLDLIRQFNEQVDQLLAAAQPPPQAPAPGQGAQAVPQAPPVSDMIPNVPGAQQ